MNIHNQSGGDNPLIGDPRSARAPENIWRQGSQSQNTINGNYQQLPSNMAGMTISLEKADYPPTQQIHGMQQRPPNFPLPPTGANGMNVGINNNLSGRDEEGNDMLARQKLSAEAHSSQQSQPLNRMPFPPSNQKISVNAPFPPPSACNQLMFPPPNNFTGRSPSDAGNMPLNPMKTFPAQEASIPRPSKSTGNMQSNAGVSMGYPPQPELQPAMSQRNNLKQYVPSQPQGELFPKSAIPPPGSNFQENKGGMPPPCNMPQQSVFPQPNALANQLPQAGMMSAEQAPFPQGGQFQQYPGNNQPPGVMNTFGRQYPAAPVQRRLDPEQMPNPIQVMVENQLTSGGVFITNQPGLLPPLVTTKYIVQDQGNCNPRFIRSSLYNVPTTADLLKQAALPFTLVISPFARTIEGEMAPPIIDFGELGPIRCIRCKAYMSPNMQFVDAGRKFQCLLCKATTEVPTEYFQHLDHTGQRVDKYERPELVLGTYEFVATKDYCRENTPPKQPAMIFVIDVSYNNMKSGLINLLCSEIKRILKHLPIDQGEDKPRMKVGFITYSSVVHFYNIKGILGLPQMMVVSDTHDMFMPLLDGFLCDPEESATVIDVLMEQIPSMFADTKETETILLPAIQAGLEALKASGCVGKLLIFNSSLPNAEAPGKLRNRDDRKLLGTEKEKTVLQPQCTAYNDLGRDCVQAGCSVDMFIFNNSYIDVATIGQVPRLTGGEIYKYTYFRADIDGARLIDDIIKNVSRPIAFDAVMRVRTSTGIRPTDFYGHFYMANTTDMEIASIDCDKSIAIEIKHDDKLSPDENVYIQVALLYTSCSGIRRLRVLNLALKTTVQIADVFKCCDLDATVLFFAKQSVHRLMELSPKAVKGNLIHRSAQILACYRKYCTSPTSAGQLILPECLKLLPLYISCMIKNDALSGGSDITCDDRSYILQFVLSMNLPTSIFFFYPRLMAIHDIDVNKTDIPSPIRCTSEKMLEDGAYILENGVHMFLWLGNALPSSFVQPLFGVQITQQINSELIDIPIFDSPLNKRIRQIIGTIRNEKTRSMRLTIVKQNEKMDTVFRHFLVEDRGIDGSASYVDFLCHMHKEIKDLLN